MGASDLLLLGAGGPAAAAGGTTIFTQTLNADDSGWADYSQRLVVPITGAAGGTGEIRVTFEAGSAGSLTIDNAAIGISTMANAADTPNNGATTATPVELLFSAASGFTLSAGQQITSDWASLSGFTATQLLVVVMDYGATNGNPRIITGLGTLETGGTLLGFNAATNSYNSAAALASSLNGQVHNVTKIEVR